MTMKGFIMARGTRIDTADEQEILDVLKEVAPRFFRGWTYIGRDGINEMQMPFVGLKASVMSAKASCRSINGVDLPHSFGRSDVQSVEVAKVLLQEGRFFITVEAVVTGGLVSCFATLEFTKRACQDQKRITADIRSYRYKGEKPDPKIEHKTVFETPRSKPANLFGDPRDFG